MKIKICDVLAFLELDGRNVYFSSMTTYQSDTLESFDYSSLPDDLWLCIFSYLSLKEMIHLSRVCKRWTNLCKDPSLWRKVDFSLCNDGSLTTDKTVHAITSFSTGIQFIDLSGLNCETITDRALGHVGRLCPFLKQLNVTSRKVSDYGLKSLARRCHSLKVLHLENCCKISDRGIRAIAKSCPDLEELNIAHCVEVSDESIGLIARKCSDLRVLNVAGCGKLTDDCLVLIGRHCGTLQEINLKQTTQITVFGIESLVRMTPTLAHVHLGIIQDSRSTMRAAQIVVNHCHNLKFLSFQHFYNPHVQGGTQKIAKQNLRSYISDVELACRGK